MPRRPRIHVPGACYHVTLRGNHSEPLFACDADYFKLNEITARAVERYSVRFHAFCWMTNHLHALVQAGEQPLGGIIKSIAVSFARYRHRLLGTSGHLFERRYGSRLVDNDSYFLTVLRYIHQNPVQAGMVPRPQDYPWSSHHTYLGTRPISWITISLGLSLFHADRRIARSRYARFVDSLPTGDEPCLDRDAGTFDTQASGADDLVTSVRPIAMSPVLGPDLEHLAALICEKHRVTVEVLRSRSSRHWLTPIRLALLEHAVTSGAANLTQVAKFLGRDPSTLSKQWKSRDSTTASPDSGLTPVRTENPKVQ